MSECLWAGDSGRVEKTMVPSIRLLSYESSVSVKENPDRKKNRWFLKYIFKFLVYIKQLGIIR